MSASSVASLFLGSSALGIPWYWKHCVAILCGIAAIWAGVSDEPFHKKYDMEPLPNQPFYHVSVFVLGIAMLALSLWGLWLGKP